MTETSKTHAVPHTKRPFFAHAMRVLAVPIILGWVLFAPNVNSKGTSFHRCKSGVSGRTGGVFCDEGHGVSGLSR